jgi:putative tryptophan/tyrosine transport system substrate-binding protein
MLTLVIVGFRRSKRAEIYSMIGRREFIAGIGGAAVWPLAARAQQGERVRRIGFLTYAHETGIGRPIHRLLRDELEQLGWSEGRNLRLDLRFGNGDATQTRIFAADLVQLTPDVIVTVYFVALRALQQLTKTIPIVFMGGGDAVEIGTVINSARPEGNVTGFTNGFESLGGKWLELLKEVAPNTQRVAYVSPRDNLGIGYLHSIEAAAPSLGVQVVAMPVNDAAGMKAAIGAFAAEPNGGLLPSPGMFAIAPNELIGLTVQYRLPAICGIGPSFPENGGLMSYTAGFDEILHGAATYVDRLLGGAKVSDLPVQYPTKFHLAVNLKTAKALGLEVPSSILARADEVIE